MLFTPFKNKKNSTEEQQACTLYYNTVLGNATARQAYDKLIKLWFIML